MSTHLLCICNTHGGILKKQVKNKLKLYEAVYLTSTEEQEGKSPVRSCLAQYKTHHSGADK